MEPSTTPGVGSAADAPSGWRAGTATARITPTEPTWMDGYAARDGPAAGTEQELHAKVVVVEDREGHRVVLGSLELLFVPDAVDAALVSYCAEEYGLDRADVFLGATHTHCGPVAREESLERYGAATAERREQVRSYRSRLEETLGDLVDEATADLAPAVLRRTRGRCAIAMSRRLPKADATHFAQNPDGPVDHDVPVLAIESPGTDPEAAVDADTDDDAASELRAVLFGYACHPTSLYQYEYSGDWAGYACEHLEERYPGATAMFVQGCGGDQKAYPQRDLRWAKRHGRTLGAAVEATLDARRRTVNGPLRTVQEKQPLRFESPPTREELEAMCESDDRTERVHARTLLAELEKAGEIDREYAYPVQAIGFGDDLAFVSLHGEVLVEYALRLKESFATPLWVSAYANGQMTYVPTADALAEGGYEAELTARYGYAGRFEPDVEDRILRKARALAERVGGTRHRGDRTSS